MRASTECVFDDPRHSAAAAHGARFPLQAFQEILGHSDIRMMTTYRQVLAPSIRDAADVLEKVLKPVTFRAFSKFSRGKYAIFKEFNPPRP